MKWRMEWSYSAGESCSSAAWSGGKLKITAASAMMSLGGGAVVVGVARGCRQRRDGDERSSLRLSGLAVDTA